MIIQLTITFLAFFAIRLALKDAKRISLIPLYLLLLARLSYPKMIYSPWSVGLGESNASGGGNGVLQIIWLMGTISVIIITAIGVIRRSGSKETIQYRDDISPQVRGLIRPVIILPESDPSNNDLILLHERLHIERGHHWIKLLFQFYCAIYWWHPLMWLSRYVLFQDLEIDCDEAVIKHLSASERSRYAHLIVNHASAAVSHASLLGGPPMKRRIRAILQRKRQPLVLSLVIAITLSLLSLPMISAPISAQLLMARLPFVSEEITFQKPAFESPKVSNLPPKDADTIAQDMETERAEAQEAYEEEKAKAMKQLEEAKTSNERQQP